MKLGLELRSSHEPIILFIHLLRKQGFGSIYGMITILVASYTKICATDLQSGEGKHIGTLLQHKIRCHYSSVITKGSRHVRGDCLGEGGV